MSTNSNTTWSTTRGTHTFKWGAEIRLNKDATIFGTDPNGSYSFGGGTAYSPVLITSSSGQHNILPGQPLPDALTGLLTATPYSYTITSLDKLTASGDKFDEAAVRREAYNFYFQDSWKATPRLNLTYGFRYEYNTRIKEAQNRTTGARPVDSEGQTVDFLLLPARRKLSLYNPRPPYLADWNGWGPRLSLDYAATAHTTLHAGGAITTLLPQSLAGQLHHRRLPLVTSLTPPRLPIVPLPFQIQLCRYAPPPYTTAGSLSSPMAIPTRPSQHPVDLQRYQDDLTAITPGHQTQLLSMTRRRRTSATATSRPTPLASSTISAPQVHRRLCRHRRSASDRGLFAQRL